MKLLKTKSELRDFTAAARRAGHEIGLVPTMGALHQGHLDLVTRACAENQQVIVSIFINPTQFDNPEDLAKYPRTLEADMDRLKCVDGAVAVFAPEVAEMYPEKVYAAPYQFDGLDRVMEGAFRKGHFDGVGTIVEALLRLVAPDRAYFGEKDYQQLQIIRKLVADRNIPVKIIPCPIVREADGLAMSSRNTRLSGPMRAKAPLLYATLLKARELFGTKSASEVMEYVRAQFTDHPDFRLEYIEIADAETLQPVRRKQSGKRYRAFIAAHLGGVRLIDNIALN